MSIFVYPKYSVEHSVISISHDTVGMKQGMTTHQEEIGLVFVNDFLWQSTFEVNLLTVFSYCALACTVG